MLEAPAAGEAAHQPTRGELCRTKLLSGDVDGLGVGAAQLTNARLSFTQ